jgi:2-keto-4-pentenoate hydratase/2-oxohepta-3-ene-1,7-dioic acid hydratase in catechol pathway
MKFLGKPNFSSIGTIHCLAYNYNGVSANEVTPLYFIKSRNSLIYNRERVLIPKNIDTWTEVEVAYSIKKDCSNLNLDNALDFISGFYVVADITSSNIHDRDHHLAFSKSRTGYCPISNMIDISYINLTSSSIATYINGNLTQLGNLSEMVLGITESIVYISSITKLYKGDLVLTGTPRGVENNLLNTGDYVYHTLNGIKVLEYAIG